MKKYFYVVAISLFTLSCTQNENNIENLEWLNGTWEREYNGNTQIENWSLDGTNLLGRSSFANGKDTTEMVTFQIKQGDDNWVLITKDVDFEQEANYQLKSSNMDSMIFVNTGKDWPQTIKYKQIKNQQLIKTVSGNQGSMKKEIELTFERTSH